MVECEAVEHFAHVEADCSVGLGGASDLAEHGIVVDVDFDEWRVVSIDVCEIAICAIERAAVGDRHQLMIRPAKHIRAEIAVGLAHERRSLADHQDFLAVEKGLARRCIGRRMISLLLDDSNLCGREEPDKTLSFGVLGDSFPQQYCSRFELFGRIHNEIPVAIIHIFDIKEYCREIEKAGKENYEEALAFEDAGIATKEIYDAYTTYC